MANSEMPRVEPLFFSELSAVRIRHPLPFLLPCVARKFPTPAMETNQIRRSLEDLTERNEALRRFL
jgi:hypothetical protein